MGRHREFAVLLLALSVAGVGGVMFDPCAEVGALARGDEFPIGLALVPGGNASDLILQVVADSNTFGLCNKTFQNYLIDTFGARIAVFNLRLDRLHVLRLPYPDLLFPMLSATTPTMTVIAFRNNINSPPAYLANGSNNTEIWGAGFVVSLALLITFETGQLTTLHWYDLSCDACGGKTSQICIHQVGVFSCATPFVNCTCAGKPELGDTCTYSDPAFDACSTAINTGFLGTDRNDAAFRTGPQIQRLNAYSLVSLYYKAKDSIMSKFNAIYSDITGQWGQLNADADAQRVEFGGSIASDSRSGAGRFSPPPSPAPPTPPAPPPDPPITLPPPPPAAP